MAGPPPKNPAVRQRRNRVTSSATLLTGEEGRKRAPQLPREREWEAMTRRWWKDVWASPMAEEFLRADEHGLFRLAVLIDLFWSEPSQKLAAEIRLQQQAYGLSPLDRRRLQWQVVQTEEAVDRREVRRGRRAVVIDGDARDALR